MENCAVVLLESEGVGGTRNDLRVAPVSRK